MPNSISYSTIFQQALDTQMVQGATSGWMEQNAGQVIYNGGKEIKIPKIAMDGLGNYDRNAGYPVGTVSSEYETMTMSQDRGKQFVLDSMDVNESNFVVNASSVMSEFQKQYVIPEVDSYRYSRIAALLMAKGAGYASGGYSPAESDIYSKLTYDIATVQDKVGENIPLVICLSGLVKRVLQNSTEFMKHVDVTNFTQGNITTKVKSIDENPIIPVPSARLKTAYVFRDGRSSGQTQGGFAADTSAKNINWIISIPTGPIAVSKTDNMKIFTPDQVQDADGYKMDYRKYHDLWIPDNKYDGMFVNIKEALA